jgi:hypothetical protein
VAHLEEMIQRLPLLYRDGELLRALLAVPAVQMEIAEEDGREVQRAHWFDRALELEEAAGLAALLDIPPEPWQNLADYRAWVHALRDARLELGSVTRQAIQQFVEEYANGFLSAAEAGDIPVLHPIQRWANAPSDREPAFVENPLRRRYQQSPAAGGIEPLHQFTVTQTGLDETLPSFLLVGLPTAPEYVPALINVTSGQALIYLDSLPPGKRLFIRQAQGGVSAMMEDQDVSEKMRSVTGLIPGVAWENSQVEQPAKPLVLKRGRNDLWFLPVAHFDALGLDRFLLILADLLLQQGRYDQSNYDHALFYQDPAALLRITWLETTPACFEIHLPAGAQLSLESRLVEALNERENLDFALNQAVSKLKAAGVEAKVLMQPFSEIQGQGDVLKLVLPIVQREIAPSGADALPEAGGVFDTTKFEDSTFH